MVIRWWTAMFDIDTSIHIAGHVLIPVFVEDLLAWWHSIYATSLIMTVFMRFHLSWSWFQYFQCILDIFIHYGYLDPLYILRYYGDLNLLYIFIHFGYSDLLYIVRGDGHTCHILYIMPIHGHCTLMYLGLIYVFAVISRDLSLYCIDEWLVLPHGSSLLHF